MTERLAAPAEGYGPRGLAQEYAAKAEVYDALWVPVIRPMALPMLDELPLPGCASVLDLGTGTGALLGPIRERAPQARLLGIDGAEGMLRRIPGGAADALLVSDAMGLPLAEGCMDAAVLGFVLFHLPDPDAGLREVRRVLRPGGAAGIVTWGVDADVPGLGIWSEELEAAGASPDPRDAALMQQARMDTPARLAALLSRAGFTHLHAQASRYEHSWTVDQLLACHVGVGMAGRRLPSLPPEARDRCRARVLARLQALPPDDLVYRPEVVWAIGVKPAEGPGSA